MASIKNLKKDVKNVLGDILSATLLWNLKTDEEKSKKGQALIEEIFATFDKYITKISDRQVENRGAHLKSVRKDFEKEATTLIEKLNQLN